MSSFDLQNPNRRTFLRTVPVAAAAGLALTDASMFPSTAAAQEAIGLSTVPHVLIKSNELQADIKAEGPTGDKVLYTDKNFELAVTTETATHGAEYEWHEYRDHIVYILGGSTMIEVGGTPKDAHNLRVGEWLAPTCEGAEQVKLSKGDTLVIPRGTPHRRVTTGTVTLTLTSPKSPVPGT